MSFVNGMLSIFEMIESSDLCACQKEAAMQRDSEAAREWVEAC